MSGRARRRDGGCEPVDPRQQDLFADFPVPPNTPPPAAAVSIAPLPTPAPASAAPSVQRGAKAKPVIRQPSSPASAKRQRCLHDSDVNARATPMTPAVRPAPPSFGADDWWTTRAVCGFLRIGRKALWNMRRDRTCDFPAPVDAVGHRHLYLASDVRAWMEAQREAARRRADDRRQALTQFSARSS